MKDAAIHQFGMYTEVMPILIHQRLFFMQQYVCIVFTNTFTNHPQWIRSNYSSIPVNTYGMIFFARYNFLLIFGHIHSIWKWHRHFKGFIFSFFQRNIYLYSCKQRKHNKDQYKSYEIIFRLNHESNQFFFNIELVCNHLPLSTVKNLDSFSFGNISFLPLCQ